MPTRISFDRVFETVWAVFRPQMGQMAVLGLVVLGVNIGLQILSQGGSVAAQATGEQAIFIAFTALNTLFGMVVQTWITIGNNIYMLKAARNEQPSINDLGRSGPFLIRAILLQLVFGLVVGAAFLGAATLGWITYMATNQQEAAFIVAGITILILALPLIYLFYGWFIAMYLIIDRNLGVMESISLSSKCMAGNRLTAFLIMLVVGMLGMLFVVFTCCLGYVLFVPYMSLALTGIYLSATGQSWGPGTGTRVG